MMKPYVEQPRIRSVKPQLFKHEGLFEAEKKSQLPLRLAFIGLFGACNRSGCFRWQAQRLKSDIFPYDAIDFEAVLEALKQAGFIRHYAYEGASYGRIPSWSVHQVIGKHEPVSPIPCLSEGGAIFFEGPIQAPVAVQPPSTNLSIKAGQITQSMPKARVLGREGKGKGWGGKGSGREGEWEWKGSGSGREGKDDQHLVAPQVQPLSLIDATHHIFEYWKRLMDHPASRLDPKRSQLIQKALKLGYSVEALYEAIRGCSLTPHNQGHNDRGQRYDGLHIIFKDSDQIDRFIHNAKHPPKDLNGAERRLSGNVACLQAWMETQAEESADARH